MIDELIPFMPKVLPEGHTQQMIEEQRRLFYVAVTRCKSSESGYPGRLIVSSFVWMAGVDALKMGIAANPSKNKKVSSTRFINDFGRSAPQVVVGETII
jgi:superfamily I DNA/RNA helicase